MNIRDHEHFVALTSGLGTSFVIGHEDLVKSLMPVLVTITTYLAQALLRRRQQQKDLGSRIDDLAILLEARTESMRTIQQQNSEMQLRLLQIELALAHRRRTQPIARQTDGNIRHPEEP